MNKIILEADTKIEDKELREWVSKLNSKIDTINERTKQHTIEIRELKKLIKLKSIRRLINENIN